MATQQQIQIGTILATVRHSLVSGEEQQERSAQAGLPVHGVYAWVFSEVREIVEAGPIPGIKDDSVKPIGVYLSVGARTIEGAKKNESDYSQVQLFSDPESLVSRADVVENGVGGFEPKAEKLFFVWYGPARPYPARNNYRAGKNEAVTATRLDEIKQQNPDLIIDRCEEIGEFFGPASLRMLRLDCRKYTNSETINA